MSAIDIIKSLLYDGQDTYGITIWMIMLVMIITFVIFYFISNYRVAFGRRRLLRRIITKGAVTIRLRFDIHGKVTDKVLLNVVKEAVIKGVGSFDKEVGIHE